jgi:hypothetical protein
LPSFPHLSIGQPRKIPFGNRNLSGPSAFIHYIIPDKTFRLNINLYRIEIFEDLGGRSDQIDIREMGFKVISFPSDSTFCAATRYWLTSEISGEDIERLFPNWRQA